MPHSTTFHIPALDCPDELALIERCLRRTHGIEGLSPDYFARNLRVEFDATQTTAAAIEQAISGAGFPTQIVLPTASPTASLPRSVHLSRNLIVAGILLAVAGIIRFAVGAMTLPVAVLAIAATIVAGIQVFYSALRALRLKALDMNVLMAIAAVGAIAIGDYFEAATAMFLFAISLWLEKLSVARAQRAVRSLVELAPNVAHRMAGQGSAAETVEDVNPAALAVGDRVLVRPGERIPADGEVLSGQSAVNQSPITGESMPIEKEPGQRVFAGTLNGEGALVVQVTRASNDSTLSHIARLVDEARSSRSPTERFVDQFARRYTPVVIALAMAIMIIPSLLTLANVSWAADVGILGWIHRGLVLLVIACPCALVISTPVTIVSGLHQASRAGILIKGGEFLEKAATLRNLALDKTGTVTTGTMQVIGIDAFNGYSQDQVLSFAAALERHSEHPLAMAVTAEATQRNLAIGTGTNVSALRGLGIHGELNGADYYLGNARLFREPQFKLSAEDMHQLRGEVSGANAKSPVNSTTTLAWLGTVERLLGVISLADHPRPGTREAITELRSLGMDRIIMLTGDNAAVAEAIAREVCITEVQADLLPQDKIAQVRKLATQGSLAMVGDGVNDAPALAAADVGIALGGQSSDTAMETADVVVMTPDLAKVAQLVRLARRCRSLLKQNIAFALATKLAVLALALAGFATLWMAVAADVGASLIVIANGMRMIRR